MKAEAKGFCFHFFVTMRLEEEIKQSQFSSPHHKAVINLIFTYNWIINRQQELFKPFGITSQQFNILRILKGSPQGISGTEIKSRMLDKNSDISRLLGRLATKGLIQRKGCPVDKRATDVFITTEGLSLLEKLSPLQRGFDAVLNLSEKEATQLSDLLDRARG
jgi:DNA-binding MarR family transcriptional regulator